MFLMRSNLSIAAYLFLELYRSTSLKSLLFLKNIKTILCKQKLVNNRSIPSIQQPYNHDSLSKIARASTAYQSQLFLKKINNFLCKKRKQSTIVVFLQTTLKERLLIFLINSLLLHIPLLALTDRQNDRQRDVHTR